MKVVIIASLIAFASSATLTNDLEERRGRDPTVGRDPTLPPSTLGCTAVDKQEDCCKFAVEVGCDVEWVAKDCEISCKKCGENDYCPEEVTCKDKSGKQCIEWARKGFCVTMKGLAGYCEKSCGICRDDSSEYSSWSKKKGKKNKGKGKKKKEEPKICIDKSMLCKFATWWSCKLTKLIEENCEQSCGKCD
jgi:hypothetical protein